MNLKYGYLSLVVLAAALTAPAAIQASPGQGVEVRVDGDHHRYYDRHYRDYHEWNDGEDRSYRVYLKERHRNYYTFNRTSRERQNAYWRWRHRHPDHD